MVVLLLVLGLLLAGLIVRVAALRWLGPVFKAQREMPREELRRRYQGSAEDQWLDWLLVGVLLAALVVRVAADNQVLNAVGSLVVGLVMLFFIKRMAQRLSR